MTSPIRHSDQNRVQSPAVRESWLRHGIFAHSDRRGDDPMVDVDWSTALDLAADALRQVRDERGNAAIFGGSYGWGSAGRFHHPQSQLKRFLNTIGGFTGSHGTYSHGAGEVVVPALTGMSLGDFQRCSAPHPDEVATITPAVVSFGGFPDHNAHITSGGDVVHWYRPTLQAAAARGCALYSITPTFGAFEASLGATWCPIRPGTDAALMLALATELLAGAPSRDRAVTAGRYGDYLLGHIDGVVRDANWASDICGLSAERIREIAAVLGRGPALLNATWSTQRVEQGEQATWALLALGALAQPIPDGGAGTTFGYGSMGSVGAPWVSARLASLPQGQNPIRDHIPVARIADALLDPGGDYLFDGQRRRYPDIDAIYWCGGNPFHHHQDLRRFERAWRRPRAVIVNEPAWTATARRADIVFPTTFGFERADLGGGSTARHLVMMQEAVARPTYARDDYEVFTELAARLGVVEEFTEGRTAAAWLEELYERSRAAVAELPTFHDFVQAGHVERPLVDTERAGPAPCVLPDDEVREGGTAHPEWIEPVEWLGAADAGEFHLVSPMPAGWLHSQRGADPTELPEIRMGPADAERLGVIDQQVVRVVNERGSLRARVRLDAGVAERVVSIDNGFPYLPTGNPDGECLGGNVNCLTADRPTSAWAQGTAAHSCLVRIEA